MQNPLISVIVPIYKVEEYLDQCITTVVGQTYSNLEIILIDDGSPDGCPIICDKWAKEDTRITVIHKKNGGLSSARNAGLDICTGDLVSFIDSDDSLELNMYEVLVSNLQKTNSDISVCQAYFIDGKNKVSFFNDGRVYNIEGYFNIISHILPPAEPNIRFEVWNKLFKKSIIGDTRFKTGQIYEDIYFDRMVFFKAERVVCCNIPLYCYRLRRPGATTSIFKENRLSKFEEINCYIEILEESNHIDIAKRFYEYFLDTAMDLYMNAIKGRVSDFIISKILINFSSHYNKYENLYNNIPFKYRVFNFSPKIYKLALNIYLLLK